MAFVLIRVMFLDHFFLTLFLSLLLNSFLDLLLALVFLWLLNLVMLGLCLVPLMRRIVVVLILYTHTMLIEGLLLPIWLFLIILKLQKVLFQL